MTVEPPIAISDICKEIAQFAEIAGILATSRFVRQFGGRDFYFKNNREEMISKLVKVMSIDLSNQVWHIFNGSVLHVPSVLIKAGPQRRQVVINMRAANYKICDIAEILCCNSRSIAQGRINNPPKYPDLFD